MKALTIAQPYATLIARGLKPVENRTWPTSHRGLLYIHAGKSRQWFDDDEDLIQLLGSMPPFGAVVAIARLVDCLRVEDIQAGKYDAKHPGLRGHMHVNGPWCWVLQDITPIGPWPWKGAQGLFEIDADELGRVANRELGIPVPTAAV